MALPRYLALTSEEFAVCSTPPAYIAWMACHFSPYGTGLVNLPPALPPGAMIILNDRIPMAGHEPETVIRQLRKVEPHCLLLDLQRPPEAESLELARRITGSLSCPVGVPAAYGRDLECPLFLPAVPPDTPLDAYFSQWKGREIWLEIGLNAMTCAVTADGSLPGILPVIPGGGQYDESVCCHYRMTMTADQVIFDIWRTREDIDALLKKATAFGVTKAVGLWQELGR